MEDDVPFKNIGVRKGTWSEEEDALLKNCIKEYGEGNWNLTPRRAGLNRCRKSCRLRWLNYLKPGINRGNFGADEIDLITRLHMLLGNKWSLIAGRLPGRTANSVKNFWNTYLKKKFISDRKDGNAKVKILYNMQRTKIIKPRPRNLTKNLICSQSSAKISNDIQRTPNNSVVLSELNYLQNSWWGENVPDLEIENGHFELNNGQLHNILRWQ